MIKDIPTADDFIASGVDFINIAWEEILDLLRDYAIIKAFSEMVNGEEDNVEIDNEYWKKVQRRLSTSLALIQQGNEFLLKGKIANKSPFLILSADWHSQLGKDKDINFSELKTIEAINLIKVYNAVIDPPLKDEFQKVFEKLRNKRNTVMHSGPKNLDIEYKELLLNILEISHHLIGEHSWIKTRKTFLENKPNIAMIERPEKLREANILIPIVGEINHLIKLLEHKQVEKYFGIDKKQRRYICPYCYEAFKLVASSGNDLEEVPKLAQLKPNEPTSTTVYCLVCNEISQVTRDACNHEGCRGNVISDLGICMTCGKDKNP